MTKPEVKDEEWLLVEEKLNEDFEDINPSIGKKHEVSVSDLYFKKKSQARLNMDTGIKSKVSEMFQKSLMQINQLKDVVPVKEEVKVEDHHEETPAAIPLSIG